MQWWILTLWEICTLHWVIRTLKKYLNLAVLWERNSLVGLGYCDICIHDSSVTEILIWDKF